MDELTKKRLQKIGKAFVGIAEAGVSSFENTAKSCARNKQLSEETRERYSEMAEEYGELKNSLHNYKEKIGRSDNQNEYDDSYDGDSYDDDSYDDDSYDDDSYDDCQNTYYSPAYETHGTYLTEKMKYEQKALQQKNSALSNEELGEKDIRDWDDSWITMGRVANIKEEQIPDDNVGLIQITLDGRVMYIIRAIDLLNGGIRKKYKDLFCSPTKNGAIYHNICEYKDNINVSILVVGNDNNSINICRNLERQLISKNKPEWM